MAMRSLSPRFLWRRLLPGLLALGLVVPPALAQTSGAAPATPTAAAEPSGPTRLAIPAALRLHYAIHGRVSFLPYRASGLLHWAHDGQNYESRLEVNVFLLGKRVQSSRGRITAAGLQPLHFNDRVDTDRTVTFDYAQGLIRFSEGTAPEPLMAGAQDHLSVFMQLGSLMGTAPQRYPPGTQLTLPAMGIYGPESWSIVVDGPEALSLPGGELATVRFSRAPARADEPRVELWLAPTLGWLPARIRLTQGNGDFVDQQWRGSEPP